MFPNIWAWFRLSVRRRFSTARDLFVPIAFATLLLCAVATPVAALSGFVESQQNSETALTQISVTPVQSGDDANLRLTQNVLDEIGLIPGVTNIIPDISIGIYAADGSTWSLTVHALNPANCPPDLKPGLTEQVVGDKIIVPATVGDADLSTQVGSEVQVSYTRMIGQGTGQLDERSVYFLEAYEPTWQGYGPDAALASSDLVLELVAAKSGLSVSDYLKTEGLAAITVTAETTNDVESVTEALRGLGFTAIPVADTLGELPGVFSIFPQIFLVVSIGGAVLLFLQLGRAVKGSLNRRTNEFALLRLRAWSARDVSRLVVLDVTIGSVIGAFLGAVLGVAVGYALVITLVPVATSSEVVVVFAAVLALTLLIAVFCAVVSLMASRRILTADPFITVMSRRR